MSDKQTDWEKLLAGPLVEKWRTEADKLDEWSYAGTTQDFVRLAKIEQLRKDADELLAHLREKVVPLLEAGQAMRVIVGAPPYGDPEGANWDAAKAKLLVKGECPDCERAAKHANSDATTAGFFYDKCERHREAK